MKSRLTHAALYAEYVERGMSQAEVAAAHGCCQVAVSRALRRLGIPARSKATRDQRGSRNSAWGGDQVSYFAAHKRIRRALGTPSICECCGTTEPGRYEWANLTGDYNDFSDYARLCKRCHVIFDGLSGNLNGNPPPRRTP